MIEKSINKEQDSMDLWLYNSNLYTIESNTASLSLNFLTLLKKMGYDRTDSDFETLYQDTLFFKKTSILTLHPLNSSGFVEEEVSSFIEKILNMNTFEELEEEENNFGDIHNRRNEMMFKRDILRKDRDNILVWTIIFQIIGMLFTQLGMILQIKWKGEL